MQIEMCKFCSTLVVVTGASIFVGDSVILSLMFCYFAKYSVFNQ